MNLQADRCVIRPMPKILTLYSDFNSQSHADERDERLEYGVLASHASHNPSVGLGEKEENKQYRHGTFSFSSRCCS